MANRCQSPAHPPPQTTPPTAGWPPTTLTPDDVWLILNCVTFTANHGGFAGSVDEIAAMVNLSKEAEFIMVGQVNWQEQGRQGAAIPPNPA